MRAFAVMGGTFDPVHNGHLQTAREAAAQLGVDKVRLLPSRQPPHRASPGRLPEQRLAMLKLAVAGDARLTIDDRELHRAGPSFTVDTLESLRKEVGCNVSVSMMLGLDAFALLPSWYRRQDVLRLVNVVVLARPGAEDLSGELVDLIAERHQPPSALKDIPSGALTRVQTTQLPISSTLIRTDLEAGLSVHGSLPTAVIAYIREHHLYV